MNDAITKNTEKKRRRLAIVFVGLSPITTCSVKSKQLHWSEIPISVRKKQIIVAGRKPHRVCT